MSFYKKYELDRLIADGEARTFRAVQTANGHPVFLHLFNPSGRTLLAVLKSKLLAAGGKPLAPLIEIGEFAGSPYAVTEAIEPFRSLPDWIAANVTGGVPAISEDSAPYIALPEPPPAAPPPPPRKEPGTFTQQFEQSPPVPAPAQAPPVVREPSEFSRLFEPQAAAPPPPPSPAPAGLVSEAPGEFTRLFEPPKAGPQVPAPAPPPSAGLLAEQPGEFTRLFEPATPVRASAPPPPRPPLPPAPALPPPVTLAPPPPPNDTGDFTRLFGSRMSGESIDIEKEHASASLATPPENKPFQAAGEFTRMFGPEGVKGAQSPAQTTPPPSLNTRSIMSSASGMFGDPNELARIAAEALAAPKPAESAPGETPVFSRAQNPPSKVLSRPLPKRRFPRPYRSANRIAT